MRRSTGSFLLLLASSTALLACATEREPDESSVSKREFDSAVGASGLPGASGITRAMVATDSAAARAARHDSLADER